MNAGIFMCVGCVLGGKNLHGSEAYIDYSPRGYSSGEGASNYASSGNASSSYSSHGYS